MQNNEFNTKKISSIRILAWPAFNNQARNPYNSQLYSHIVSLGNSVFEYNIKHTLAQYDIWHIHWPEVYLGKRPFIKMWGKSQLFLEIVKWMKRRGTKIIWTTHNISSHEHDYPEFEDRYWSHFIKNVDGWISLTNTAKNLAVERFPQLESIPQCVIPHGHYKDVYENSFSSDMCRNRLGLSPKKGLVILYFGLIRPYKNIPLLIQAFKQIHNKDVTLIVAGQPNDTEIQSKIKLAAADSPQVRLFLKFIAPEDVQIYFNAANLVVLPFHEILNSGSALLSLSFNKPVLVPNLGSMKELQSIVGKEWVHTFEGEISPAILENVINHFQPPLGNAPLDIFDWDQIGQKMVDFYRTVLSQRHVNA